MSSIFMFFKNFNVFYFYAFQRLQCLMFSCFSETSMSSTFMLFKDLIVFCFFMLFKDFNIFYFYAFQTSMSSVLCLRRLQCLLFLCFLETLMSSIFMLFKDFNVFYFYDLQDFNIFCFYDLQDFMSSILSVSLFCFLCHMALNRKIIQMKLVSLSLLIFYFQ